MKKKKKFLKYEEYKLWFKYYKEFKNKYPLFKKYYLFI